MRRWRNPSSNFEENECMSEKLYFMKIVKIIKTCSCDSLRTPMQKNVFALISNSNSVSKKCYSMKNVIQIRTGKSLRMLTQGIFQRLNLSVFLNKYLQKSPGQPVFHIFSV